MDPLGRRICICICRLACRAAAPLATNPAVSLGAWHRPAPLPQQLQMIILYLFRVDLYFLVLPVLARTLAAQQRVRCPRHTLGVELAGMQWD